MVYATDKFYKYTNEVYTYDSIYEHANKELILQLTSILRTHTKHNSITIQMHQYSKQSMGSWTCNYYALAAALYGLFPTGLEFQLDMLISHMES